MTAPPRVVLLLDPRPGQTPADQLQLPGGQRLIDAVGQRVIAEAGQLRGIASGSAELARLFDEGAAGVAGDGPWCVLDGAALALETTYGDLVADPRPEPAVLRAPDGTSVGVRLDGALGPGQPFAREVAPTLSEVLRAAPPGEGLAALAHTVSQVLTATGAPPRAVAADPFPLRVVTDDGTLTAALAEESAVDEPAVRLRRASRADDGFLSTFLVRPLSRPLTRRAVALGLHPAAITAVSGALGLLAAGSYALAGTGQPVLWRLLGSLLLAVSLVIDCVDGEVARYTRTFSPLGGWLDIGSDRIKEYAVYAGLAAGARPTAWGLATAAFAVLVVRHFVDFGFAAAGPPRGGGVAALSERTSQRAALMWAKRAIIMPVGERTIALIVLAPLVGPRWTLGLLLAAGCVAAAYTTVGRVGRRLRSGSWSWLTPASERLVEQGGLALLVGLHRPAALPGAYLLLAAVAFHQYDAVYRHRLAGAEQERTRTWLDLVIWPVRVVAVVALTFALGAGPLGWVLAALGALLGLAAVADSVAWWHSFVRSGL